MIFTFSVVYIRLLRTNNMHIRLKKALLNFPREFPKMTLTLTLSPCRNSPTRITSAMRQAYTYLVAQKFGSKTVILKWRETRGFVTIVPRCLIVLLMSHMPTPRILSARKKSLFDMWHL